MESRRFRFARIFSSITLAGYGHASTQIARVRSAGIAQPSPLLAKNLRHWGDFIPNLSPDANLAAHGCLDFSIASPAEKCFSEGSRRSFRGSPIAIISRRITQIWTESPTG